MNKIYNFFVGDDLDYYERYLINLNDEELEKFFERNPDFMEEYNMYKERLHLLRDKMYREILKGIYKK